MKKQKIIKEVKKIKEELSLMPIKVNFYNKFYFKALQKNIIDTIDFKSYV